MRRAIPNPCNGPSAWRVFKIIRSRVPCNTSDLSVFTVAPLAIARKIARLLCNVHMRCPIGWFAAVYGLTGISHAALGIGLPKVPRFWSDSRPDFPMPDLRLDLVLGAQRRGFYGTAAIAARRNINRRRHVDR